MTLEVITHPLLEGARHGFFTRKGGASSGVYQGLNCGRGSADQQEAVTINRTRVADWMGVTPETMVGVHQTHSAKVVSVSSAGDGGGEADGLVTKTPGLALCVLTADCQPVLFHDPVARVVGATHAGWKGAIAGILAATVEAMEGLGARRSDIRAVIGPSISQEAYEVGPEFRAAVLAQEAGAGTFFKEGAGDRLHFDLPGFGLDRLKALGIGDAAWTGHCTYADADRFYSYRRSVHRMDPDYGRLIAAIRL